MKRYVITKKGGKAYRIDLFRLAGAFCALLAWAVLIYGAICWADICAHNCTDQNFASWNALVLILGRFI